MVERLSSPSSQYASLGVELPGILANKLDWDRIKEQRGSIAKDLCGAGFCCYLCPGFGSLWPWWGNRRNFAPDPFHSHLSDCPGTDGKDT